VTRKCQYSYGISHSHTNSTANRMKAPTATTVRTR
jgi:hypothetical protein